MSGQIVKSNAVTIDLANQAYASELKRSLAMVEALRGTNKALGGTVGGVLQEHTAAVQRADVKLNERAWTEALYGDRQTINKLHAEAIKRIGELNGAVCVFNRADSLGAMHHLNFSEWRGAVQAQGFNDQAHERATLSMSDYNHGVVIQYGAHAVQLPKTEFERIAREFLQAVVAPIWEGAQDNGVTGSAAIPSWYDNEVDMKPGLLETEADRIMRVTRGMV